MRKLKPNEIKGIYSIVSSVLTLVVVVLSLTALKTLITDATVPTGYLAITFFALAASRLPMAMRGKLMERSQIAFVKNLIFAAIYILLGILLFVIPASNASLCIICSCYFLTISANRICLIVQKKAWRSRFFNALLALAGAAVALLGFISLSDPQAASGTLELCLFAIMIVAMAETIGFVLFSMQFKGILKIMRKTYAFEVLYGLIVLILACSFYFSIMEESIPTFGDGLWYCFAIVTTIGFGDLTAVSLGGRFLSVVLGCYGLVVVAVITSIIVNFYSEVKDKKEGDDEPEKVEPKKEKPTEIVSSEPPVEAPAPEQISSEENK